MMVAESNEKNYFEKKRDCTEEEEEIAGLVAGLSPPLAKEIVQFIDNLQEVQTEKQLKKLTKIMRDYFSRGITLKEAFEKFNEFLSPEEYILLIEEISSNHSGKEVLQSNGISSVEEFAEKDRIGRKKLMRDDSIEFYEEKITVKRRKRSEKDMDEPFEQGNEFSRSRAKKISWTEDENQKLSQIVKEEGTYSWKRIATLLNTGKTASQCNQHWKRVLNPEIRKGPWEPHEEELLCEWTGKLNYSWKEIQRKIPNRTDTQCRHQYYKALECSKSNWSLEEEARLQLAVTQLGKDWVKVASDLQRRTALQCRERWEFLQKIKREDKFYIKSDHHHHTESAPQQQNAS